MARAGLEILQAPTHDRNVSLGWLAIAWLEHFAVHGPGDVQGRPLNPADPQGLPLDDEFLGLILDHYALGADGRRMYDSAFTSRPKGRAKSELAAFEVLFEAFGPCRFSHWAEGGETYTFKDFVYRYERGEPVGRPVTYPYIRCLATEEGQAGNTYDNVHYNLTEGPLSEDLPKYAAGLTRVLLPHGGEIVPSTASNAAKDGGKETHVVFDETHLYVLPELQRMYNTVRRNMAKRKDSEPWSHETSTMYLPGENSVAEETHKFAKLIQEGKAKRGKLYFNHAQASGDVDLTDEAAIIKGLHEAYGPFAEVMDLERIIGEIHDPRNDPGDSRRYFFNQPTSSVDAFVAAYEWEGCRDQTGIEVRRNEPVTLGFDGSRGRARGKPDATALVGCRVSDGHLFEVGVWEAPADRHLWEDWQPPLAAIDAAVRDAFQRYRVVGFYADPAKDWRSHVNAWESLFGHKVKVKVNAQHPFEWWFTGGRTGLNQRAIEQFEGAVRNADLTHDGAFKLTEHILNARRRIRANKLTLAKEHDYSNNKIDAAVAAVLAFQARLDAIGKGIGRKGSGPIPRKVR